MSSPGVVASLLPPGRGLLAESYKDWLHVNVVDHDRGAVGLVNASLHGDPGDRRAVAVGSALLHLPGRGWCGAVEVVPQEDANVTYCGITMASVAVTVDPRTGMLAASMRTDGLEGALIGSPAAAVTTIPTPLPFGSGWISWSVTPRLRLTGEMNALDVTVGRGAISGYHDHNWGRWRWGEDVGWDWATLLAPEPAPAIVLSRATDRRHSFGEWRLTVTDAASERLFSGHRVQVTTGGRFNGSLRRLPGATAVAQVGRSRPTLPAWWQIRAGDGFDQIEVMIHATGAAQIVLAEPTRPGYSYLHEVAVTFSADGRIGGRSLSVEGLGIVEGLD